MEILIEKRRRCNQTVVRKSDERVIRAERQ